MALSIRTNVASINAQRSLSATQSVLESSLSRLSSGFRITKAAEDAAGLGVSTKLESQLRSYNQAARNASDGVSVVQSAEAGLGEQASILVRLRELAMQAASDGVGDVERGYIDQEAKQLLAEVQRISQVTEYNGTKLLDGSATSLDFQVGVEKSSSAIISLSSTNTTTATDLSGMVGAVMATAHAVFIANLGPGPAPDATAAMNAAIAAASALTGESGEWGTLSCYAGRTANSAYLAGYEYPTSVSAGIDLVNKTAAGGTGGNMYIAMAQASFKTAITSGATYLNYFEALMKASMDTAYYPLGGSVHPANYTASLFLAAYVANGGAPPMVDGNRYVSAGPAFDAGLAALAGGLNPTGTPGGLGLIGMTLASKASARGALAKIDSALEKVSSARAAFGATGSRLQSAITTIQSSAESLSAANSRIKDVDVAEETSRMSRAQILAQAGAAVLAQANQAPQLALKLLG